MTDSTNDAKSEGQPARPKTDNVYWSEASVERSARETLLGHGGCVLWFTGLSGSGKSTLARKVEEELAARRVLTYLLDGDNVRHGLNGDLAFSAEDRRENVRRMGEVAALFADAGLVTLVTVISPYRDGRAGAREAARASVGEGRFFEVHVDADLSTCEARDPKGLYKRARSGEISDFTGISAPYEAPENPDLRVDTGAADLASCTQNVLSLLSQRGVVSPTPPTN